MKLLHPLYSIYGDTYISNITLVTLLAVRPLLSDTSVQHCHEYVHLADSSDTLRQRWRVCHRARVAVARVSSEGAITLSPPSPAPECVGPSLRVARLFFRWGGGPSPLTESGCGELLFGHFFVCVRRLHAVLRAANSGVCAALMCV